MNKLLLKKLIKQHYSKSGEKISFLKRAKGYNINSQNFIIGFSSKQKFFLKALSFYNKSLLKKLKIIAGCYEKGVRVAKIIKTKTGKLYIIKKSSLVVLFEYYSGLKCQFSPEEILSAGENLAHLNQQLRQIKDIFKRSNLYNDLSVDELEHIKQNVKKNNAFGKKVFLLCQQLPDFYDFLNKTLNLSEESYQLVHLDYHPQNVLFKNQKVEAILDFDSLITAPKLQTIAFGADRFSKNIQEMKLFLKGYCKVDKTLPSKKLRLVPIYIQREALHRINYILRSYFFYKDKKWSFDLDKHFKILHRMNAIKWIKKI